MTPKQVHKALKESGWQRESHWVHNYYGSRLSQDKEVMTINPNYKRTWSIPLRESNCHSMSKILSQAEIKHRIDDTTHTIVVRLKSNSDECYYVRRINNDRNY